MHIRIKYIVFLFSLLITTWVGYTTYRYFGIIEEPSIQVDGIGQGGYASGDTRCTISGCHPYKISDISIVLDSTPLMEHSRVGKRSFSQPFTIATSTLGNGQHTLRLEARDGTYHKKAAVKELSFTVDNTPLQAAFVKPEGDIKVFQGHTLHLQFQVNKDIKDAKVHTLSHTFPCFAESKNSPVYECFVPIACEEKPNEYLLTVEITDHVGNTMNLENKFQVMPYPFKKENLTLDKNKVKEEQELGRKERELEEELEQLVTQSPQEKMWKGVFYTPVNIARVTTEFGAVRVTQEKGKYAHKALDVIAPPKSVVWATQDGIVVLKDRFVHSGNTVVIDHGYGIQSLFFHLDSFADVEVGDKVKRGNPIGTLGKTGYATGYHLHWELRVNNVAVDPMEWTKPAF